MKNKILALLLTIIMVVIGTADGTVYTKAALTDVYYEPSTNNSQIVDYGSVADGSAIFVDDYYCALKEGKAVLYATKCKGNTLTFPSTIAYNHKIYKSYIINEYLAKDWSDDDEDFWPGHVFEKKKNIKKIVIPENVEGMLLYLSTWKNIKEIHVPASARDVTLGHTTAKIVISKKNKYLKKYKNGLYTTNGLYKKKKLTLSSTYGNKSTFTVKKGTKYINFYAFYGYKKLKKLVVPSSVNEINGMAFENCKNLKTIVLEEKKAPKIIIPYGFTYLNKNCKIYVKNQKVKKSIEKQLKKRNYFKGKVIVKK